MGKNKKVGMTVFLTATIVILLAVIAWFAVNAGWFNGGGRPDCEVDTDCSSGKECLLGKCEEIPMVIDRSLILKMRDDGTFTNGKGESLSYNLFGDAFFDTTTKSYDFDGVGDYVSIPNSANMDTEDEVTIMFDIKLRNTEKHGYAVSKVNSYMVQLYKGGKIAWGINGGLWFDGSSQVYSGGSPLWCSPTCSAVQHGNFVVSTDNGRASPSPNTWISIVYTVNQQLSTANSKLYVNGVLVDSARFVEPMLTSTRPITIGDRGESGWDRGIDGQIRKVRIYKRALTTEEITSSGTGDKAIATGNTDVE